METFETARPRLGDRLRPAFRTPWGAFAWSLFVLVVLASPLTPLWNDARARFVPPASALQNVARRRAEIFDDDGRIDLLILGTSRVWFGIDDATLTRELAERGAPGLRIRTIGYNRVGCDIRYEVLRQLLERRSIGAVLLADSVCPHPHLAAPYVLSYRDDRLTEMPLTLLAPLHAAMVMASARLLRYRLWPPADLSGVTHREDAYGSYGVKQGWRWNDATYVADTERPPRALPLARMLHDRARPPVHLRPPDFDARTARWTDFWTTRTEALLEARQVPFAYVTVPRLEEHLRKIVTFAKAEPPSPEHPLIGATGDDAFEGFSLEERRRLFYASPGHLNVNGALLYTRTVAPAIAAFWTQVEGRR